MAWLEWLGEGSCTGSGLMGEDVFLIFLFDSAVYSADGRIDLNDKLGTMNDLETG